MLLDVRVAADYETSPLSIPKAIRLDPEHIAETYWMLHRQPRDAWTHELDLRPWMEKW